jgi:single-strand DNA-binding protein
MRTENSFRIKGFVGQDPEIKTLESGKKLISLVVATNETFTDKSGESKEVTDWHQLTLWGKLAEIADKHVKKGALVAVEGKIKPRTYENKEGKKSFTIDLVAESIDIILIKDIEK